MPVSIERRRPRTALSPWRTLMNMDELDRPFFQNFFNRPYSSSIMRPFYASEEMGWTPAMDVLEKEDRFIVRADLPGMSENDIDVSVVGDTLTIKGELRVRTNKQ